MYVQCRYYFKRCPQISNGVLNEYVENIIRALCNVLYVQWNGHRKLSFVCAYKREMAGPMRFKMAGKFKMKTSFLRCDPVYNAHNALAKHVHVYTERSGR